MASSEISSSFAPFGLPEYIHLHARCLDFKRFQAISMDGKRNCVYDTRNGANRLSDVGGWVKRWMH